MPQFPCFWTATVAHSPLVPPLGVIVSRGGRFARDLALKPQTVSCSHCWVAMEQSLSPSLSRGGFYTADLCSFVPSTQAEQLRDLQRPELWQGAALIARGVEIPRCVQLAGYCLNLLIATRHTP